MSPSDPHTRWIVLAQVGTKDCVACVWDALTGSLSWSPARPSRPNPEGRVGPVNIRARVVQRRLHVFLIERRVKRVSCSAFIKSAYMWLPPELWVQIP